MQPNGQLKTVVQEFPGDLVTPVAAYLRLQPLGARFLLESVEGGERSSRYSFLGLGARARLWSDSAGTWCQTREGQKIQLAEADADPLDAVLAYAEHFHVRPDPRIPRCLGGLVGYVGYDYARRLERLGQPPPGTVLPELMFELVDELIIFDHPMHRVYFASLVETDEADRPARRLAQVRDALNSALEYRPPGPRQPEFRELMAGADYCGAVEVLQEHIRAGDIFQAVLSAEVEVLDAPPMFEIYRALRRVNPSPYMFFMDFTDLTIAGSSPESAVRLEQRRAWLRPIAGTRPRGRDEESDRQLERELLASVKEGAEHAMLVDLARNDLSRVARPGTVKLSDFRRMERFSHVMHLVSDVEAELAEGVTAADLLRATFPAGTVSGAPKIRAMQLIDEHESTRRNLYAGCAGYLGLDGTMDMALVIRTAVRAGDRTTIRAGAGVVAGSTPEGELGECQAKLAAMVTAIRNAAGGQA